MKIRAVLSVLALSFCLGSVPSFAASKPVMDDGRLERDWFSPEAEFREADEIDYLWVKPGFELDGKSLQFVPWPKPKFLGENAEDRDGKDMRLASEMSEDMPVLWLEGFERAFEDRVKVSQESGDIRVEGRIVDCSTGNVAAKVWVGMGAGSGSTTLDIRFVDAATGEVLGGMHHRAVSGTAWSSTDSEIVDWIDEVLYEVAKKGFQKLYTKGEKVRN